MNVDNSSTSNIVNYLEIAIFNLFDYLYNVDVLYLMRSYS